MYLGTAYMSQWIPDATSPESVTLADQARAEFRKVLEYDPRNASAYSSLAFLAYSEAGGPLSPAVRTGKFDEAVEYHKRVVEIDPQNKLSFYSLGVIGWRKFYPELMQARERLGMKPEDPGPLPDANARVDLMNRFGSLLNESIRSLERALEIDPQYDEAMAYMNLLVRERADLRDTPEEYARDIRTADEWVQKTLDTKRAKAAVTPPPPVPDRIRVGGNVQSQNLITKVTPVYPQEAKDARIQGTVRLTALIGKDGRILNLQLVSGHPLLVPSAQEAVRQWVYRPTLLNGQPVEVVTQIDVNYTLSE